MKVSWSHCVLKVRDLDAMVKFYCDTMGWVVSDRGPMGPPGAPEIVFMTGSSSDHHQMALVGIRGDSEETSLDHNAFRVESVADVKAIHEKLTEDPRVEAVAPLTHGNAISVYFKDPEGNGIEIFCDTPWHVKQPAALGWDPSLPEEEVLAYVEGQYREDSEFRPMAQYRAEQAKRFEEE